MAMPTTSPHAPMPNRVAMLPTPNSLATIRAIRGLTDDLVVVDHDDATA